jgi:hypothetical protein
MKNLYKSLAQFQKDIKQIPKDSSGYGYKYCRLDTLIKIVTPVLNKNGLVLIQSIDTDIESRLPSVKTTLAHIESSESIVSWTPVSEVKLGSMNHYQSVGAGITYFRRYSLQGMLGIFPDEDIDANEDPAPASIKSKPKMTDSNYSEVKERCLKQWKKEKSWAEIQLMVNNNYTIVEKQLTKLQKEITNAKR